MSEMHSEAAGPDVRLSGRALAAKRREALARYGKGALGAAGSAYASSSVARLSAGSEALQPAAEALQRRARRQLALERRQREASSRSALSPAAARALALRSAASYIEPQALAAASYREAAEAVDREAQAVGVAEARSEPQASAPAGVSVLGGARALAMARRQAIAVLGKVGMRRAAYAARLAAAQPQRSDWLAALKPTATAREIAMQRRLLQSQLGRIEREERIARPTGRVRPKAPSKVEQDATLAGQTITGNLPQPSVKVTGMEAGSCRVVTGTEYLGERHYSEVCRAPKPEGGVSKVTESHTARGARVSGTDIAGDAARLTGQEAGFCAPVTGTEYLDPEGVASLCGRALQPAPQKVSSMTTRSGERITGTPLGRSLKVTGDEAGACRPITGTPYLEARDAAEACAAEAPRKVEITTTGRGVPVTGTEVVAAPVATGDMSRICAPVTGTEYLAAEQQQTLCGVQAPPPSAPPKVRVHTTWRGQTITGTSLMTHARVTGMEAGACAPVSGTPYLGPEHFAACAPEAKREVERRTEREHLQSVTGDRPGVGGGAITGDEKGACQQITGTPYVGPDNAPLVCPPAAGRFRLPQHREGSSQEPEPAGASEVRARITGSVAQFDRVTGPIAKAEGLVTGTPEFRATSDRRSREETVREQHARLTGEAGVRARVRITGDAWEGGARVTGTEGDAVRARSLTLRGAPRGEGRNARSWLNLERPEVPASPVTGSAGTTMRGATVTVSGGARG